MATLVDVELLGIFEDRPQADFVATLVETVAPSHGYRVVIEPFLTAGCRSDNLAEHLTLAPMFAGVVIGIDGRKVPRERKITQLRAGTGPITRPTLWSIAHPAIEEWLMADPDALPTALRQLFGHQRVRQANRPGRSQSEQTAKRRLSQWVKELLGVPALRGGTEYATDTARNLNPARVGASRNGDLKQLLDAVIPAFLKDCSGP